MKRPSHEIRLFVSYSHLDRDWFGKLRPLLKFNDPMQTAYVWRDHELTGGREPPAERHRMKHRPGEPAASHADRQRRPGQSA